MKRYAFRFEPLLFQRQTREEQMQQELARENQLLEARGAELTRLFEEYRSHQFGRQNAPISPGDLELFNNYAALLRERLEQAKTKVREQRKVVDEVTKRLAQAHIDKEVVEKLKEKDRQAYYEELRKQETKQLDEMTIIRFASPALKKHNG